MKKTRKFVVEIVATAEIEISQELLDGVLTDEWRSSFYNLQSPEDVAAHLAQNYARGASVTSLDGFADRKDSDVKFKDEWYIDSSKESK